MILSVLKTTSSFPFPLSSSISLSLSLSLSLLTRVHNTICCHAFRRVALGKSTVHMYLFNERGSVCVCVCVRERERERVRVKGRECVHICIDDDLVLVR